MLRFLRRLCLDFIPLHSLSTKASEKARRNPLYFENKIRKCLEGTCLKNCKALIIRLNIPYYQLFYSGNL